MGFLVTAEAEMEIKMEDMLRVGVIASTHGIRGEVKVFPTTEDVNRFRSLKQVVVDDGEENPVLKIAGVKFFKQFAILKFKGYDSIEEIEKFKGKDLLVSRADAIPLEEDEYYISDLIGLRVAADTGEELGILEDVLLTGANDVYVVRRKDGREALLPAIKQCIKKTDLESGIMTVHVMEGLLEE